MTSTAIHEVKEFLARPAGLMPKLMEWHRDRNKAVVGWAWQYEYTVWEVAEIMGSIERSQHPLGNMTRQTEKPGIPLAYIDWPLAFLFHRLAAEVGPPTVEQFTTHIKERPEDWITPMRKVAADHNLSDKDAWEAMLWRIGIAWQSSMRELHMHASFNDMGIPVRYHPLADVLFAVDGWCGRDLFMLYKEGNAMLGGKRKPEDIFPPGYRVHRIPVPNQGYGKVWLAPSEALERAIDEVCNGNDLGA